ncbi:NYN domain-containing protein [Ktedonospora formicarum]|uniref:NYN domain-containing protein n=1 Tax=Ktedonospora formicarum TaxID=2778364 RepID=A0A8J3I172_9CHLR|nr:NYN domain-containing protein [Ktedonospora formicarum]GHO44362.1 hypothetical protein KSX_25250 [Ktedonospora formicarum]
MTTKHSHSDHNDVDANVTEHPSVPEITVEPTTSESATPVEETSLTDSSSAASEEDSYKQQNAEEAQQPEVSTTPVASSSADAVEHAEKTTEVPLPASFEPATSSSEQEAENTSASITSEAEPVRDEETSPSISEELPQGVEISATVEPSQAEAISSVDASAQAGETVSQESETPVNDQASPTIAEEKNVEAAHGADSPTAEEPVLLFTGEGETSASQETKEEEVRSFTSFIEEFRQAEAQARYDASLHESQLEAFALLSPLAQRNAERNLDEAEKTAGAEPQQAEMFSSEVVSSTEAETPKDEAEKNQQESSTNSAEIEEAKETEVQQDKIEAQPAKERAVSPLLRPASRIRLPRHSARHLREEREKEKAAAEEITPQPESQVQPAPAESAPPRPARRYRFDRPASTASKSTTTSSAHSSSVNGAVPSTSTTRAEESVKEPLTNRAPEAQPEKVNESTPVREPQTAKKTTQDTVASDMTTTAPVKESGRRRSHERQKEVTNSMATPTAASNIDNTPSFVNTASQVVEEAPEDLPPLEYSELQKASTRRRRRHRTSTTTSSTSVTPETTIPTPPPLPTPPREQPSSLPAASGKLTGVPGDIAYSIVSGYTINQMNQGNDLPGPFMGPEPSPARGSVISRDGGRTVQRAEVHRSPSYPAPSSSSSRGHDNMPSTAALNHFTNAIVQALQLQSDRLVTEMRRQSQAPTNVSVSLPPFPSTERVGVFVDVANLLYSARTLRMAVDFGKLLDFLRGNRRLVRAHAYCPTSPQAGDEQMFLQAVKGLGYRITTKNYKTFSSGAKKADLDLDLCMDVVRLVDGRAVDCIVLVSGDSDFMPMLDYCSDHGVRVEVAAFDEAMSATLRQSCDLFVNLSLLEEIRS